MSMSCVFTAVTLSSGVLSGTGHKDDQVAACHSTFRLLYPSVSLFHYHLSLWEGLLYLDGNDPATFPAMQIPCLGLLAASLPF